MHRRKSNSHPEPPPRVALARKNHAFYEATRLLRPRLLEAAASRPFKSLFLKSGNSCTLSKIFPFKKIAAESGPQ